MITVVCVKCEKKIVVDVMPLTLCMEALIQRGWDVGFINGTNDLYNCTCSDCASKKDSLPILMEEQIERLQKNLATFRYMGLEDRTILFAIGSFVFRILTERGKFVWNKKDFQEDEVYRLDKDYRNTVPIEVEDDSRYIFCIITKDLGRWVFTHPQYGEYYVSEAARFTDFIGGLFEINGVRKIAPDKIGPLLINKDGAVEVFWFDLDKADDYHYLNPTHVVLEKPLEPTDD